MEATNMMMQLAIGFLSGVLVGVAVFSNPFSRAVVTGVIAGVVVSGIMVDGVETYLQWATDLPAEIAQFAGFWIGLIAGFLGGVGFRPTPP
jgi:hypothetical protein